MPTGYTAGIKDGMTFEEYALGCAKAFGACITMRDDTGDQEIPDEFEVDEHHLERKKVAEEELIHLGEISQDEAINRATVDWEKAEERRIGQLHSNLDLKIKYDLMLAQVKSWEVPTTSHVEFYNFMVSQLEESIDFDCSSDFYSTPTVRMSGEEWLSERMDSINRRINYHAESYEDEVCRVKDRNSWIKALREGLRSKP